MHCRRLQPGDAPRLQLLAELYHAAFELEDPLETHPQQLESRLANANFIAYVLEDANGTLVGGLTAFELPAIFGDYAECYVSELAIAPEFHGRGLGRTLMKSFLKYCKSLGFRYIFMSADPEDEPAVAFYRSLGATEDEPSFFYFEPFED